MATLADILTLDWETQEFPEGFMPIDAIVMVKGVYEDGDDFTRPVWSHRWTVPLSRNIHERIGVFRVAQRLGEDAAMSEYSYGEDEDEDG